MVVGEKVLGLFHPWAHRMAAVFVVMAVVISAIWSSNLQAQNSPSLVLEASPGNSFSTLAWSLSGADDVTGYRIERRVARGGEFEEVTTLDIDDGDMYLDLGLETGTRYVYRIIALPESLGLSDIVSVTPSVNSPTTLPSLGEIRFEPVLADGRKIRFVYMFWTPHRLANGGRPSYDVFRRGLPTVPYVSGHLMDNGERRYKASYIDHEEGETYHYGVQVRISVGGSEYLSPVSWGEAVMPVLTPTGLTAEQENGRIFLSWNGVDAVEGYQVLRRRMDTESRLQVLVDNTRSTDARHTDVDVETGSTYRYVVAAVRTGGISYRSNQVELTKFTVPPPAPQSLSGVAREDGSIVLSWDPVDDSTVTGYQVFVGHPSEFDESSVTDARSLLTEVSGNATTTYTDTRKVYDWPHVYRVRAVNSAGVSDPSDPIRLMNVPSSPYATSVSPVLTGDGRWTVSLNWMHHSHSNQTSGFQVLRRGVDSGEHELTVYVENTGDTQTSYLDANVTPGWLYQYRVKAINEGGHSAPSSIQSITVPRAVSPPRNLRASAEEDGTVRLTWDPPEYGTVTGYRILLSGPSESYTEKILVENTGNSLTTYTDAAVSPQQLHVYRVIAIDDTQVVTDSLPSNHASVYPLTPPPLSPPRDLNGTLLENGSVELSWDVPLYRAGDVAGYQILRRIPSLGQKKMSVHVEDTGTVGTTYVDDDVESGMKYVYRVKAISEDGTVSGPSKPTVVKTPSDE